MDNETDATLGIILNPQFSLRTNKTQPELNLIFGAADYSLFGVMLGLSAVIGIYFGYFGKQDTTAEYLMGGKRMKIFPISMSLVASMVSGITLLGVPSDVYQNGATYWLCLFSILVGCLLISYVYMPVFYKLQLTSSYEYLKLRFDARIRILASVLFVLMTILYIPIVIYVPALAFAQVSGLHLHLVTVLISLICIFYTCIGGLKAVVWTDTLQMVVMVGSMVTVFFLGLIAAGGFTEVWTKADQGDRLKFFEMDPDPTNRDSFWTVIIGFTFSFLSFTGVNQSCVQRFLALPSIRDIRISLIYFTLGIMLFKSISVSTGLIMHAMYADCDPLTLGSVQRTDQLLPYHVMDVASQIPGLPGLFIAGVVGAALSTLSTALNTLSGILYEDFIHPYMPKNTTEKTASNIMKCIVLVTGTISVAMVFVVEHLGSVWQLSFSFGSITGGPLLGLFTLGMLFPSANAKGALYGGISGLLVLTWIVLGNQLHIAHGNIKRIPKSLTIDNCDFISNITNRVYTPTPEEDLPFVLYRISFYYYTLIGTACVIIIGLAVSWITKGDEDPEVDRDLLSPVIYWMLPMKNKSTSDYFSKDNTYHVVVGKELELDD